MSPRAFSGKLALAGWREGFVEVVDEASIAGELAHRVVVGDVIDSRVFSLG